MENIPITTAFYVQGWLYDSDVEKDGVIEVPDELIRRMGKEAAIRETCGFDVDYFEKIED